MKTQPIVFAYWHNNEFKGFRADTFNTISKEYAKVYSFSRSQVDTVLGNVKSGCNRAGQQLMKIIKDSNTPVLINAPGGGQVDMMIEHVSGTEKTFREWGEFEIRVIPINCSVEEMYEIFQEEWKISQFISNLPPALEIHKFKIMESEN